jgi:hypothetical protein
MIIIIIKLIQILQHGGRMFFLPSGRFTSAHELNKKDEVHVGPLFNP